MIDSTIRTAWSECAFCSKSKFEVAEIISDEDRWEELPVQYKCAWKKFAKSDLHVLAGSEYGKICVTIEQAQTTPLHLCPMSNPTG